MAQGNGSLNSRGPTETFPENLRSWLVENSGIIIGLGALRALGEQAHEAVNATLAVSEIGKVTASWQLWEALARSEGHDPEALLLLRLPVETVTACRYAFWGVAARHETL